jgi:hypothetical protein
MMLTSRALMVPSNPRSRRDAWVRIHRLARRARVVEGPEGQVVHDGLRERCRSQAGCIRHLRGHDLQTDRTVPQRECEVHVHVRCTGMSPKDGRDGFGDTPSPTRRTRRSHSAHGSVRTKVPLEKLD